MVHKRFSKFFEGQKGRFSKFVALVFGHLAAKRLVVWRWIDSLYETMRRKKNKAN